MFFHHGLNVLISMSDCEWPIISTGSLSPELSYQRGVRYTYRYSTAMSTTLRGANSGRNGLALDFVVDIQTISKCHLMLKVSRGLKPTKL